MNSILVTGAAALLCTVAVIVSGFPSRIRSLYGKGNKGSFFYSASALMYGCWAAYGWCRGDLILAFGALLGLLSSGIVLGHVLRRK